MNIAEKMVCPLVAPGIKPMLIAMFYAFYEVSHEPNWKRMSLNKVFTNRDDFLIPMIVEI